MSTDENFMTTYQEDDKIMVIATGEVLTVMADFSAELDRGIVVREDFGRNLAVSEVRPAGHTRQRSEAGKGITPPEPFPPPPPPVHVLL